MKFITPEELTALIPAHLLDDISNDNYSILDEIEGMVLSEVDAYLSPKFDTEVMFNKKGNQRPLNLKRIVIDNCIYHLFCRVSGDSLPMFRTDRYNQNISFLKQVLSGSISPQEFTMKEPDVESMSTILWGSEATFNNINY